MKVLFISVMIIGLSFQSLWAEIRVNEIPSRVELKEKSGGRLDGTPWGSDELKGKVHLLFYVDPDEKDLNNEASEAVNREHFPSETFQSFGIINMAATWMPNFMISSSLKDKQEQYPRTIYVRDYKKVLVKAWGIGDDNSDVLLFDKQGRVIFRKDGQLDAQEIKELIRLIKENL